MLTFVLVLSPTALYALIYAGYSLRMGRVLAALGALLAALLPISLAVLLLIR